jgi:rSAM/selenodomain-associated transferase 2
VARWAKIMTQPISIIIPVLDEAPVLEQTLQALQVLRTRGHEVIVVDGGSRDTTLSVARNGADRVLMSGAGRALQMNAGADVARHELLLFLHADTQLPQDADELIAQALLPRATRWGRFDIRLNAKRPVFRLIEQCINWRSALSGIATGDQAIFVERIYFERVGFYDRIPLMEDVSLSKKLLHFSRPARITTPVVTSARRWEREGVLRSIVLMWRLRTAFFFGADPERLVLHYYPRPDGED